jgi:glycosyltransferase 2 family protein
MKKKIKLFTILFIKILFVFICFYYLLNNNFVDFNNLIPFLFKDLKILIILFSFTLVTIFLAGIRWHLILKSLNFEIEFKRVLEIVYIGTFFNNLLIGGYGGDAMRIYYIFKASEENKILLSLSVFVDRLIGFAGLVLIGIFFLLQILNIDEIYNLLKNNINIVYFSILIIFIILFILIFINFAIFKKTRDTINRFITYLFEKKKVFFICLAISILLFGIVNLSVFLISDSIFNFQIDLKQIFVSNSVTVVMNSLPITPGGVGIGELSFIKMNNLFLDSSMLFGLANVIIFFRIINFIVSLPAIIFYVRYKNKNYKFNH